LDKKIIIGIATASGAIVIAAAIVATSSQHQLPASGEAEKVKVVASFFPLYDFAKHVGRDKAEVSVMIPAGIEPHDWEPRPRDIVDAEKADLVVYNGAGFESWVSDLNSETKVDTSKGILLVKGEPREGHGDAGLDPHIWLDPLNAKTQVRAIRDGLVQVDPKNADYYNHNAEQYMKDLDSLDALIRSDLSKCERKDFIAFHSAFSYFSNRYGLVQHSIQGVSPEGEVLPQRIQEIKQQATDLGIQVIYAEELVDPRLANVIANEIPNGRVLVLSPIEGWEEDEIQQGLGYIDKMKENVENLKVGLKCS
jgi:zinc transport system substrate-binding protein